MFVSGPFFNLTEAAGYCGYKSADAFRRVLKEYSVPRHGPMNNRYAKSVLDAWMSNPSAFKAEPQTRRRTPRAVVV